MQENSDDTTFNFLQWNIYIFFQNNVYKNMNYTIAFTLWFFCIAGNLKRSMMNHTFD